MKLTGVRKKIHPASCEDASKYQLSKPIDKRGCIINKASGLPGATQMVQAFSRKHCCEVLHKIMTVSVLNRNKWLLQALGRLGGSSCFPEKDRGPPPAEHRRASTGPLNIDYLIIQDNRNPWLFKHGTAPSSWAFHSPNELLEEWDAKMSSSNSPKTGTQTAIMESSLQLKGLISYFLSLFLSLSLFFPSPSFLPTHIPFLSFVLNISSILPWTS